MSCDYKKVVSDVVSEISKALMSIDEKSVVALKEEILKAEKVYFVAVGRVMLSMQSAVKRLAHLGISAHYVGEITEPCFTNKDLLIVASGSGSSIFPLNIAKKARALASECKIIHIGSNNNSEMKNIADFMVRIPVRTKNYLDDEIDSVQPMTSLFEQTTLLLMDIIAKMIIDENINMKDLWQYHANLE